MDEDRNELRAEAARMGYGSLGGEGVDTHESVRAALDPAGEGVKFTLSCNGCGAPIGLIVPWDELIFMSQRRLPNNGSWIHSPQHGCFMPNMVHNCRTPVGLGVTPEECTKHLHSGIAGGKVNESYVRHAVAQITGAGSR